MRIRTILALCILSIAAFAQADKPPAVDHFASIAWLTGGVWTTDVKGADGTVTHVENHIRYSPNHKAIEFNTDFNGHPHYSGFYAWDAANKALGFWYTSAEGDLTIGTSTPDPDGKTLHQDFTITEASGATQHFQSTIVRDTENSYDFTVLANSNGKWSPVFQIHYTRKN